MEGRAQGGRVVTFYTVRSRKGKDALGNIWNAGTKREPDWHISSDRRERGFLFIDQAARALWMRERGSTK